MSENKQVSFTDMVSLIVSQLDREKYGQLQPHYTQMVREEISQANFFQLMRGIVGDHIITKAIYELIAQAEAECGSSQLPESSSLGHRKLINSDADMSRHIPSSASEIKVEASDALADINGQISQAHWHSSSQNELTIRQVQHDTNRLQNLPIQSQRVENQPIQSPIHQVAKSQYLAANQKPANLQQTYNKQMMSTQNPTNTSNNRKQVSLVQLRNEVSKEEFLLLMKEIVGDQILKKALCKLQTQPWCDSSQDKISSHQIHQGYNIHKMEEKELRSPATQDQRAPNHQLPDFQYLNLQQLTIHQTAPTQNPAISSNSEKKQLSLGDLVLLIVTQLDNDKCRQLLPQYTKLLRKEISKDNFLRLMKGIVGGQIIKKALYELEAEAEVQAGSRQLPQSSSPGHQELINSHADVCSHIPSSAPEIKFESNDAISDINGHISQDLSAMVGNKSQNLPIQCQRVPTHQVGESQYPMVNQNPANLQQTSNKQTVMSQNPASTLKKLEQVSLGQLARMILPLLDKDKFMQLKDLYIKLRRNKVPKERFLRLMKDIVGDQMIITALYKLQKQAKSQDGSSKLPQISSRLPWKPITSQQKISIQNAENTSMNLKQVSFEKLIQEIVPQLDTNKNMQLHALYIKLRRNEVSKEGFVPFMKEIVGDQVFKMALYKLHTQAAQKSQAGPSQVPDFALRLDNNFFWHM